MPLNPPPRLDPPKVITINKQKYTAVLIAGGNGFKIYSTPEISGWIIHAQRKYHVVAEDSDNYSSVSKYVNIKYLPKEEVASIETSFNALVSSLGSTKADAP